MRHPDTPPLFDGYWDPFWSACAERGPRRGRPTPASAGSRARCSDSSSASCDDVTAAAGSTDREELFAHADAVADESVQFFHDFLNSVLPRRPLWQLMLGGVFDRHPGSGSCSPRSGPTGSPPRCGTSTSVYDGAPRRLPAERPPSEYWPTNCLVGASFIHKAEVDMRHEIGVETIAFGRDFPHPEGTWPHTREWLRDAFAGVPEDEARAHAG